MNISNQILSDITVYAKYARYLPDSGARETWGQLVLRNMDMHMRRYPTLVAEIHDAYQGVFDKKILPSMRSMQFGGRPIELSNSRIYNCAYMPAEEEEVFSEAMFLLLGGTGLGYSVQRQHVAALPVVVGPRARSRKFVVGDSIEGWSDAVKVLVAAYFNNKSAPVFDFSDIREKGAPLITSGGKAPGPVPLKRCIHNLTNILDGAVGRQLTTLEVHDMLCHIADAVLAGGIRRAALIALFSKDDMDMMSCKTGTWWELNPQRGRANNSVVLERGGTTEAEFSEIWGRVFGSGAGEPGVYWTNNLEWGTNPCCEIALKPYQFCNLCEINASAVENQEDFELACARAAVIGTLQAGYTDFHYLREKWRETTEEEALLGVGITGIASGKLSGLDLERGAQVVRECNERVAAHIGINPAARCTTIKPSGTSSMVLGCPSGIHAAHAEFYVRRIRLGKNEALYSYLVDKIPALVEDEYFSPHEMAVLSVPQKSPDGAALRTESIHDLLGRVAEYNEKWVRGGHVSGDNTNNVSCTISLKWDEWGKCGRWMFDNNHMYNGISVLPYDGGTYVQAPFEEITEERYNELMEYLTELDLSQISENTDETDLRGEAACAGGACEI